MEKKELFTYKEKQEIYEVLKEIWRSSDTITYRDLEKIQVKEWGGVAWKWATLRNKASIEGWNKEKGLKVKEVLQKKREEILQGNTEVELLATNEDEYINILQSISRKYQPDFEKVREGITEAINTEDTKKLRHIKTAIETLESARSLDLKLCGCLDISEHRRLETELLKLELMTTQKTEEMKRIVKLDKQFI